ncbi:MAG: hypothetical protein A2Y62_14820 [Candidatus Fischerbacteria bacterium RBG_13_37_8]|uniref:Uncharacterized protein n=1 Tax=Candidatus Fischerbacteria bacterium RBG_13_37_8 TaxID=1817863 RepID=A0A1F5VNW0_9BACT|nr:MAG: hypothetical protein A2Y62_14820 [Candidatus Fischerbacteria bacterium RBG_13_37_8]
MKISLKLQKDKKYYSILTFVIWIFATILGVEIGFMLGIIPSSLINPDFECLSHHAKLKKLVISTSDWLILLKLDYIGYVGLTDTKISNIIIVRSNSPGLVFLYNTCVNAVIIIALSIFQWLLLRKDGIKFIPWVLVSTIGYLLSLWIITIYQYYRTSIKGNIWETVTITDHIFEKLAIVIFLFSLGLGQWLILRKKFSFSMHWIFLTALGLLIGVPLHSQIITRSTGNFVYNIFFLSKLWPDCASYNIETGLSMGIYLGFFTGLSYIIMKKKMKEQAGANPNSI